eukprot:TRINITY_DN15567_c1_g1_i1.p1 TRINITY_DN15567_c1_g1~~TRINITY_DN15567_c1_g1_i1.p1  ORF type:complete len:582 (+),score=144.49 TRINITY_DN15567_c1_g1_i1:119-1864(+)
MEAARKCRAASRRLGYCLRRSSAALARKELRTAQRAVDDSCRVILSAVCLDADRHRECTWCEDWSGLVEWTCWKTAAGGAQYGGDAAAAPTVDSSAQTDHLLRSRIHAFVHSKGTDTPNLDFEEHFALQLSVAGAGLDLPQNWLTRMKKIHPTVECTINTAEVLDMAKHVLHDCCPPLGCFLGSYLETARNCDINMIHSLCTDPIPDRWQGRSCLQGSFFTLEPLRKQLLLVVLSGMCAFVGKGIRYENEDGSSSNLTLEASCIDFLAQMHCLQFGLKELLRDLDCTFDTRAGRVQYVVNNATTFDAMTALKLRDKSCAQNSQPDFSDVDSEASTDVASSLGYPCGDVEVNVIENDTTARSRATEEEIARRRFAKARRRRNPHTVGEKLAPEGACTGLPAVPEEHGAPLPDAPLGCPGEELAEQSTQDVRENALLDFDDLLESLRSVELKTYCIVKKAVTENLDFDGLLESLRSVELKTYCIVKKAVTENDEKTGKETSQLQTEEEANTKTLEEKLDAAAQESMGEYEAYLVSRYGRQFLENKLNSPWLAVPDWTRMSRSEKLELLKKKQEDKRASMRASG